MMLPIREPASEIRSASKSPSPGTRSDPATRTRRPTPRLDQSTKKSIPLRIWITIQVFSSPKVWEVLARPGDSSLPILLALDLVIAMSISWWPFISDYNRFSSTVRGGFIGTFLKDILWRMPGSTS
jgi:hypothetical protein